ncbi:hypothetical protein Poli38472_014449 [Pythium oligandrum]|uniref:Uncharacterized protein n=1 Tax=Pythium oligandrum TaxID=41045 RepID=A0A8K1FJR4_PYTOL|nr:hypothetical protein Poli38472_014449 [Pythium oligandrum]|eukprot:TMW60988.1 hypothetical protein Poli38472_014449 [Pythium oligandrum]
MLTRFGAGSQQNASKDAFGRDVTQSQPSPFSFSSPPAPMGVADFPNRSGFGSMLNQPEAATTQSFSVSGQQATFDFRATAQAAKSPFTSTSFEFTPKTSANGSSNPFAKPPAISSGFDFPKPTPAVNPFGLPPKAPASSGFAPVSAASESPFATNPAPIFQSASSNLTSLWKTAPPSGFAPPSGVTESPFGVKPAFQNANSTSTWGTLFSKHGLAPTPMPKTLPSSSWPVRLAKSTSPTEVPTNFFVVTGPQTITNNHGDVSALPSSGGFFVIGGHDSKQESSCSSIPVESVVKSTDSQEPTQATYEPQLRIAEPDVDPYGAGAYGAGLVEQTVKAALEETTDKSREGVVLRLAAATPLPSSPSARGSVSRATMFVRRMHRMENRQGYHAVIATAPRSFKSMPSTTSRTATSTFVGTNAAVSCEFRFTSSLFGKKHNK